MVWPTSDQKGEEARARGTGVGGQASLAGRHSLWMDFWVPFSEPVKGFGGEDRRVRFMMTLLPFSEPGKMTLAEMFARETLRSMNRDSREKFVVRLLDDFFASITLEEKKEMMLKFVPAIAERMMEGMSPKDRKEVLERILPIIIPHVMSDEPPRKDGLGSGKKRKK